jgi:PTS system fructose-specific IIC component
MMGKLYAVIEAADSAVQGVLAGEALRKAARAGGRDIEIEVRTGQGVLNPLPEDLQPGDTLLLVAANDDAAG